MDKIDLNRINFWQRSGEIVASCYSAAVPRAGEYVNINGQQWKVKYVAWALDGNGKILNKNLRANVKIEKVTNDEVGPADEIRSLV